MTSELLAALGAARAAKRPVVLATKLPEGRQKLLPGSDAPAELALPELLAAAARALDRDESLTVKLSDGEWFLHVHNPPLRLVVVGAVHIAQALVPMAAHLALSVVCLLYTSDAADE